MKISRNTDFVTVLFSLEELKEIARHHHVSVIKDLRCTGKISPTEDALILIFGDGGRRPCLQGKTTNSWIVQLDVNKAGFKGVERFGMSATTWHYGPVGSRTIVVDVPAKREPLRQYRPVMAKVKTHVPADRAHVGLAAVKPRSAPTFNAALVSDEELIQARDVFNRAIERGWKPQFDGRGHILYFDHRVGM